MRPGILQVLLIILLILILFGSAKIPAMAKNIANGIKTFKHELKDEPKPAAKKKVVAKKKSK